MPEIGDKGSELFVPVAAGHIVPSDEVRALLDPKSLPGCQQADTCPAAGRGPWLRHTDKGGQRSTVDNGDGTFWNRACPVNGCTIRVYG